MIEEGATSSPPLDQRPHSMYTGSSDQLTRKMMTTTRDVGNGSLPLLANSESKHV